MKRAAGMAAVAALALAAPCAAQDERLALTEDALKSFYLQCERGAARRALGADDAALCSVAYERLLRHTFGGDFFALLAWWKRELRRPEGNSGSDPELISGEAPDVLAALGFGDELLEVGVERVAR